MSISSKFYRLKVPAFDLLWYEGEDDHYYILSPGGGGNTKSGVKNQIMIAKYRSAATTASFATSDDIAFNESHFTDSEAVAGLCNGVHVGQVMDREVACAMVNQFCILLGLDEKEVKMDQLAHFEADFSEEGASLNACLVTTAGTIVTGGDDHVVRVWGVHSVERETDGVRELHWQTEKVFELKSHKGAISALCEHPTENWICSAGKDGACKLWDFTTGKLIADIPCMVDGLLGMGSAQGVAPKIECRGCAFSPDGYCLFTIQGARKGGAFLIKWDIVKRELDEGVSVNVVPSKVVQVGAVPLTRLAMSQDGQCVAVGGSDGKVTLLECETLKTIKSMNCHDMPVTGLGFAPTKLSEEQDLRAVFASCSVDNKIGIYRVSRHSTFKRFLIVFFLLLIAAVLFMFTLAINHEYFSQK